MAEQRTCGGCTACCKTHGVDEIAKESGQWCAHCSIGRGCDIYTSRPSACRDFKCAWLEGVGTQEYRPDKIGIVPQYKWLPHGEWSLALWEVEPGAFESNTAFRWVANNLVAGNLVLLVYLDGDPELYLPPGHPEVPMFSMKGRLAKMFHFVDIESPSSSA